MSISHMHTDLELSDFISSSPCLTTRTPGQLLSLTSHLTFGSGESKTRLTSNFMNALNRQSMFVLLFILVSMVLRFPIDILN